LQSWLAQPNDDVKVKDIRELIKLIRLIGDSVGKFIKREMKLTESHEIIDIYHHMSTDEELKHNKEIISLLNKRSRELNELEQ